MTNQPNTLLAIQGLTVDFDAAKPTAHRALDEVSFEIRHGETLGLVGESGSGKTVLAHSILGLLPSNGQTMAGRVEWQGRNLLELDEGNLRHIRGKEIAMIFQDPQASLNPVYPAGKQIEWVLKLHRNIVGDEAKAEVLRLFEAVKLHDPARCARSYPHQLSGGMCQRVMIAMALACEPKLLIADEPTSALDVTTQAEILSLLSEIGREFGMTTLFISHDIRAVAAICDRIVVMLSGKIVETDASEAILKNPFHAYTRRLVASAEGRINISHATYQSHASGRKNTKSHLMNLEELPCQP